MNIKMKNSEICFEVNTTKSFDVLDVIRMDQRCLLVYCLSKWVGNSPNFLKWE